MDMGRVPVIESSFINSSPPILFEPHCDEFHKNPYPTYRRLQRNFPVAYWDAGKSWIFTGYSDVISVISDNRFSNNISAWQEYKPSKFIDNLASTIRAKLMIGDVERRQLLRQFSPLFSIENASVSHTINKISTETVHALKDCPGFDLIADFCHPIAIKTITRLFGIDEKYIAIIIRFVRASIDLLEPSQEFSQPELNYRIIRINAGLALIEKIVKQREHFKGGDLLIDQLIDIKNSTSDLSCADLATLVGLIIFSGLDCLMLLIAGSIHTIIKDKKSFRQLLNDNSLYVNSIKEAFRFDNFIKLGAPRYALQDCQYEKYCIGKGERVYPIIAAAQRDPAAFENPDELNILRPMENFMGFGHGIHSCVGQSIALITTEIAMRKLFQNIYPLTIGTEPAYDPQHKTFRMMTSLKIIIDRSFKYFY